VPDLYVDLCDMRKHKKLDECWTAGCV